MCLYCLWMDSFWTDRRVVVTGGAGVLGSYMVDELVRLQARVVAVDNLQQGDWQRIDASGGVECVEADVREDAFVRLLDGCDVVMNFAAIAPGLVAGEDLHERLFHDNLEIARAVLDAVIRKRVGRMLVVSSSCVYPDDAPVPTPEMALEGTLPEAANRGYGAAKRLIEQEAVRRAAENPWLRIAIARPFNILGGRDWHTGYGAHVIP